MICIHWMSTSSNARIYPPPRFQARKRDQLLSAVLRIFFGVLVFILLPWSHGGTGASPGGKVQEGGEGEGEGGRGGGTWTCGNCDSFGPAKRFLEISRDPRTHAA